MLKFEEYNPGRFKIIDSVGDFMGYISVQGKDVFLHTADQVYCELTLEDITQLKEFMEGLKYGL